VGDLVEISGKISTARDKAYQKIIEISNDQKELPIDLKNGIVYHCGPLAKEIDGEWEIISAGPTTSNRLDENQVEFVKNTGVKGLVGKGGVGEKIAEEISELGCIYLAFPGGAGALASEAIESVEKIVWEDLGMAEAIWVLEVKNFGPLVVAIDSEGKNLYL